jgi:hypothetical protein
MKGSTDDNPLKEIRTKEMPRYNHQGMDGDEPSVFSPAKWSPSPAVVLYL